VSERIAPKQPREEFSAPVKRAAWKRCNGRCEGCGKALDGIRHVYDHKTPTRLGGPPTLDNVQVLCDDGKGSCNYTKTHVEDLPGMAALKRYGKNRLPLDIDRPERKPGSIKTRKTNWPSRPFDKKRATK
jgi:5-methylcytosine-specific restriction endonuclease McrA